MRRLIEKTEKQLFAAPDTVCLDRLQLVTEAYDQFADHPMPVKRALAFDHVLRHMKLDMHSNPVFAGNTSSAPRAWMLVPEFGFGVPVQVEIEHSELAGFLDDKIPEEFRAFWEGKQFGGVAGIGHLSLDFDMVVNRGLEDALGRIDQHHDDGDPEQRTYREAMAIGCKAVIAWAGRYADLAEEAAQASDDPLAASCLRRVAEACRHVPAKPARSLFEGLQAITLVHLASVVEGQGMSMSIGLPDRALARFCPEVEEHPAEAAELVSAFLLKVAANSHLGRGSKTQAITVGGATKSGDACNAVTMTFLDAFAATPVSDPQIFLRWHDRLDESVWQRGLSMLSTGRSMPLLVNDHQVVPGLIEAGVSEPDAWDYCIVGCNELGIPGRCCQTATSLGMGFNDLDLMDQAIRAADMQTCSTTQILDAYERKVYERTRAGVERRPTIIERHAVERPFPFCSTCCRSCIESGQDLQQGMPYPDIYGIYTRGTANAANALAAVEHLVNEAGRYTLAELVDGVDSCAAAVLGAIAAAPKWGNDIGMPDAIAIELNRRRDRALRRAADEAGVRPFALCHVVRSLHHVDGRRLGATLDGREAGSPVGDSLGAVQGTQTEGPTALLNSLVKLDAARWFTGLYNLNLTLPAGPRAEPNLLGLLAHVFFQRGGQELQVNVLDATELRRAKEAPDQFPNLVVRIAGLNARFVELSEIEQDELIRRAEAASNIT